MSDDHDAPEGTSPSVECEHDWTLLDPGGPHTDEHPWQLWCRRCKAWTPACDLCLGRQRLEGSRWCAVCRPRIRKSLPTFEEMLAHPWWQPDEIDLDAIVYKNVLPQTVALPFTPGGHNDDLRTS